MENVGIEPDIEVRMIPKRDHPDGDSQLKKAVEIAMEELAGIPCC